MSELEDRIRAVRNQQQKKLAENRGILSANRDEVSYLPGLVESFLSGATTEFLGGTPDPDVQQFRAANPLSGLVSSIGGFAVPAIGIALATQGLGLPALAARAGAGARALGATGKVAKGADVAGKALAETLLGTRFGSAAPVKGAAAQLGAITGVEETFRLGAAAVAESLDFNASASQVAREIPINVAFGSLIGAGGAGIKELLETQVPRIRAGNALVAKYFPNDFNPNLDPQTKLQQLYRIRETQLEMLSKPENEHVKNAVRNLIEGKDYGLETIVLNQKQGAGKSLVSRLTNGTGGNKLRPMRQWFTPENTSPNTPSKYLRVAEGSAPGSKSYFDRIEDLQAFLESFGLPKNFLGHVLYPRAALPRTERARKKFTANVLEHLQKLDDELYYAREADTNLYVVAMRAKELNLKNPGLTKIEDQLTGFARVEELLGNRLNKARALKETAAVKQITKQITDLNAAKKEVLEARQALLKSNRGEGGRFIRLEDNWLIFKTDDLGIFRPNAEAYKKAVGETIWETGADRITLPVRMTQFNRPLRDMVEVSNRAPRRLPWGNLNRRNFLKALDDHFPPQMVKGIRDLSELTASMFSKAFAPAIHKYTSYQPAQALFRKYQSIYEIAERSAYLKFAGETGASGKIFREGENAISSILRAQPKARGGLEGLIDKLDVEDLKWVNTFFEQVGEEGILPLAERNLRHEGYTINARKLIHALSKMDERMLDEYQDVLDVTGETRLWAPLLDHLMMSRTWEGTLRLPLFLEKADGTQGAIAYIIGAKSGKQARELAEKVQKSMLEKHGTKLQINPSMNLVGKLEDARSIIDAASMRNVTVASQIHKELRGIKEAKLGRFQTRSGVKGFQLLKDKNELKEKIFGSIREMEREKAKLYRKWAFRDELADLKRARHDLATDMEHRLELMEGGTTGFSKWTNEMVDNTLGKIFPAIGRNGATRIANGVNRAMFNLTLGAFDVGFPAMNAVTFVQTVLPESSLVLTAPASRLASLYEPGLIPDASGWLRPAYHLSPAKLSFMSFKRMSNPTDELARMFNRGVADKTLTPNITEAFVGQANATIKIKEVLEGREGWLDYLQGLSSFMPSKSEEFARLHSFTNAYIIGKEIIGLTDDSLYKFAKQFTERTMYVYDQPFRANLIQGPVGSAFGLFKNWSMHYLAAFGQYMGEGFHRNNWSPLLWSMAGTSTVAGAGGIPLAFLAEGFSQAFSDKSVMENLYNVAGYDNLGPIGVKASDTLYYGLPALLGVTLQSRTEAPTADPMRDMSMLTSFAIIDRFRNLGKAFTEGIDFARATGALPTKNPLFLNKMARALAPRTLYRTLQLQENGVISSINTGSHIIETTLAGQMAHVLGFTPVELQKAYDLNTYWRADVEGQRRQIESLGKLAADQMIEGNWEGYTRTIAGAAASGVPVDSLIKSGTTRAGNQGLFGDSFLLDRADRERAEEEAANFGLEISQ